MASHGEQKIYQVSKFLTFRAILPACKSGPRPKKKKRHCETVPTPQQKEREFEFASFPSCYQRSYAVKPSPSTLARF
jgi:hypothetical protein